MPLSALPAPERQALRTTSRGAGLGKRLATSSVVSSQTFCSSTGTTRTAESAVTAPCAMTWRTWGRRSSRTLRSAASVGLTSTSTCQRPVTSRSAPTIASSSSSTARSWSWGSPTITSIRTGTSRSSASWPGPAARAHGLVRDWKGRRPSGSQVSSSHGSSRNAAACTSSTVRTVPSGASSSTWFHQPATGVPARSRHRYLPTWPGVKSGSVASMACARSASGPRSGCPSSSGGSGQRISPVACSTSPGVSALTDIPRTTRPPPRPAGHQCG
jgi:hypothetical protein